MSRNTILISILFFGFPVFLFIGSYYYEFNNKKENLSQEQENYSNLKRTSLFHTLSRNASFSISGNITKRLDSNKIEIRDLEICNNNTGELITSSRKFIKCLVHLGKQSIKIIEYMNLPIGENWESEDIELLEKKISLNSNNEINYKEKLLLKEIKTLKEQTDEFKKKILYHKEKGFKNIKNKIKERYIINFINKLLVCAIAGDEMALKAINNFEEFFSIKLKMHLKGWHKNAIQKVNILTQKE